ncbi:MAG: hypothetical protein BGO39_01485 [Chloroflexi bacterium 54-19]|nr:MAG: hypothetical protein BGO39_01485 [Chloroflexi bacterium 54-19]
MGAPVNPGRVTSVDVARHVGVSQSTVSRTFSNDSTVAPETRRKVLQAAIELGYTPNAIARSLSMQQTLIVGIMVAHSSSPFQPYAMEKLIQGLQRIGRQALVFTPGPDQEFDDVLPIVLQYQVDALIVTAATLSSERLSDFERKGTPVILFNRYTPGEATSAVCCDNIEGGRMVANLLLDAGHKRLAYIAGNQDSSTNRDRMKGFTDRLWERGAIKPLVEQAGYTYEEGYAAARRLLARDDPPDAIFCAGDIIALGALDQARDAGVKVPQELSVIGFDDIPMASWSAYSLTTVREPIDEMIDLTMQLLVERLENPDTEPVIKLLPGTLVRRRTARLPGS